MQDKEPKAMPEKILDKVIAYNKKHNLICEGDRILAGLSGGADSVCLFLLLLEMRKKIGFELRAAHIHHGIRPEAEEDVSYVKELCKKEGVFLRVFREDVPALAKAEGLSEEEAGREVRYRDFQKAIDEWMEDEAGREWREEFQKGNGQAEHYKIAVAHHENDQAETVLFQLFRGSGLSGLRGMLPRRGNIIRPILGLTREEIEEYLKEKDIPWCEDRTNASADYSRNKIRHEILPYAEKEICHNAVGHIGKTAEILQEAETYIRRQTEKAFEKTAVKNGEAYILLNIPRLAAEDVFLQKQILLYSLEQVSETRKDIGSVHVEDILKLIGKDGNGELFLPGKIIVRKFYDNLIFVSEKESRGNLSGENVDEKGIDRKKRDRGESEILARLMKGRGFLFGEREPSMETECIALSDEKMLKERFGIKNSSEIMAHIPEKRYTKWLDYDKINSRASLFASCKSNLPYGVESTPGDDKINTSFCLRHRQAGDYLTIDDQMRRKSIKDYMIQEKIPAALRDKVWLLADGKHIIWVPGGRISAYYKVTEQTKTILQVEIKLREI